MEKEKWIDEVLESTKKMQRAEPSPFFFEQISAKINSKNYHMKYSSDRDPVMRWALACAVGALLTINIMVVMKGKISGEQSNMYVTATSLNNSTLYLY